MSSKEIGKRKWKWEKSREMKGRKNDMKRKEEKKNERERRVR